MPSSKFNQRPVPRRRPSICIAPAGSCWPPYDRRRPPNLRGYVHWRDNDPLEPASGFTLLYPGTRTAGGTYAAERTLATCTIGVWIQDNWPAPSVDVGIWLLDVWRPPEWYNWLDVPMPIDIPFETRLLTKVYIPGNDFRIARFTE